MALDMNGTEGAGRTKVFASTATNASLGVNSWVFERIGVGRVSRYH